MRRLLLGLALASMVVLGLAPKANAQFAVSVNNPYTATSFSVSGGLTPLGYEVTTYSAPYAAYAPTSVYVSAPTTTYATSYLVPTVVTTPRVTSYIAPTAYYTPTTYLSSTTYVAPTSYLTPTAFVATPTTYVTTPTTYVAPTSYAVTVPTVNVQTSAPVVVPTGYYVGYRPGLVGRILQGIYGGPVYYPY